MIIYGIVSIVLFFGAVYIMSDAIRRRRGRCYTALCAANAAASYIVIQLLQDRGSNGYISYIYILPLLAITATEFVLFTLMRIYKQTHVTPMSVKEAVDMLPDGMCYYYDDGRIKLVNHTMNDISREVLGGNVTDGAKLWEHLHDGDTLSAVFLRAGDEPMVQTKRGSVYDITRVRTQIDGVWQNELIASDITDEYELQERLNEKNEQLRQQKKRLLMMNDRITDLTIEKEILQAKINIHDDLGKLLIAIKQYRAGDLEKDELLAALRTRIMLLDAQKTEPAPDDYATIMRAAEDVGIKIEITGDLPQDDDNKQIVATALRECITNTFRHANGDTLYVRVFTSDIGEIVAQFTNNGKDPDAVIKETGGLRSLRDLAEQRGAVMNVHSSPHFMLEISMLPQL